MKALKLPEPETNQQFSGLDPLDSRYYDAEVSRYLSEHSRIAYQAYVETALAYTLAEFKICSLKTAKAIEAAAQKVTTKEVYKEEELTRHDIKALVNSIKKKLDNSAKPYVHFGATSYDIIATAQNLQMREACNQIVIPRLKELLKVLIKLAETYATTPQIGRTHGQHGVPITFGFAISEYIARLGDSMETIQALTDELQGKFSGAVGSYNALSTFIDDPIQFEASVLQTVGLKPAPYSTQIIPPEGLVRLLDELTIMAGIMGNLGHDMRHLQRTEISEVCEKFEEGQTGSSTMAHKKNPINFENVVSLSKQVIAQSVNANLNLSSEHQRDLTDSASARFYTIIPACVASMSARLTKIMSKIEVDEVAMQKNLAMTGGAIAAEPLYLLLAKHGHTRAHEKSKALAHEALANDMTLVEAIEADREAHGYWHKFSERERKIMLDPARNYTGLATKKTKLITNYWKKRLN